MKYYAVVSSFLPLILVLGPLTILVLWIVWLNAHPRSVEEWPIAQGTIQSVGTVVIHAGRSSRTMEVANFSYYVKDEYFSGRLTVSNAFSIGDHSPRKLVNQEIDVRYNPQKPEKFSIAQNEVDVFLLGPYYELFGVEDVDPIVLNLNKT